MALNADAAAGSVTYTRLDSLDPKSPGRFVSGIYVEPKADTTARRAKANGPAANARLT